MEFTLGQAAKETGKSKSTISKAIKNGALSAEPQPDGSYRIDAAELFRVYDRKVDEPVQALPLSNGLNAIHADILIENRELKTRLELLEKYVDTLETDKQFLQGQLSKMMLLLTHAQNTQPQGQIVSPESSKSWWKRLLSR